MKSNIINEKDKNIVKIQVLVLSIPSPVSPKSFKSNDQSLGFTPLSNPTTTLLRHFRSSINHQRMLNIINWFRILTKSISTLVWVFNLRLTGHYCCDMLDWDSQFLFCPLVWQCSRFPIVSPSLSRVHVLTASFCSILPVYGIIGHFHTMGRLP